MKEKLKAILEIVEMSEELKPIVTQCVDELKSYGPELDKIIGSVVDWIIKKKIEHVKTFQDAGFSREEAIYMTMDEWWGISKKLCNSQKSKK